MKKQLHFLLVVFILINTEVLFSQTTEDFESETIASTTFTNNSQVFNISSTTGETYDIIDSNNYGWNGSSNDVQYIDNLDGLNGTDNGSSFTIKTNDGTDIIIKKLYLYCSTDAYKSHNSETVTISGKKDNTTVFSVDKTSGFQDPEGVSTNNGFTFIDFATEWVSDYSTTPIDELTFTSTGDLDYMALDAFTWGLASTLSTDDLLNTENSITIYPNPSSENLQISNIKKVTQYEIYNIVGKRLLSGKVNPNEIIKINQLNTGIHILKLEGSKIIKFVKK